MRAPRLPDWVVYGAVVLALLVAARGRQERADAPAAPPPVEAQPLPPEVTGGPELGPASPFDPGISVDVPERTESGSGTAFSINDQGVWLTARHVVEGCDTVALVVGGGRGVAAAVRIDPRSDAAVLSTVGGAQPLPLGLDRPLRRGERAFHPGYPQGTPGEATSRLIGRETLHVRGRGARDEPVLAWAETGRTDGLDGSLSGLSGAPALDGAGRIVGVTMAESPRRGRIYTTAPESLRAVLSADRRGAAREAAGAPVTVDNYGRVADGLRRELRVAQVVCLAT